MARFSAVLRKHRIAVHGIEAGVFLIDPHREVVGHFFLDQYKRISANRYPLILTPFGLYLTSEPQV